MRNSPGGRISFPKARIFLKSLSGLRRADDVAWPCDCVDPGVAGGAGRAVFHRLEHVPAAFRGGSEPPGRLAGARRRRDRCAHPADADTAPQRRRDRPARRRCAARAVRSGSNLRSARWCADNCAPRRRASPGRNSPLHHECRRPRLAAVRRTWLRCRRSRGRSSACRGRAREPCACREQSALRVRQALVRRRSALARRFVPRRGRVRFRQGSLRLPHQRHAAGDPGRSACASISIRPSARSTPKARARSRPRTARRNSTAVSRSCVRSAPCSRAAARWSTSRWRLTSRVKANAASALFEQIEFQYGPEERALKDRRHRRIQIRRAPAARRRSHPPSHARHRPADRGVRPVAARAARRHPCAGREFRRRFLRRHCR